MTGKFQCTKCKVIFTSKLIPQAGWHLECPNMCVNEITYDIYPPKYDSSHKYFKWLNYKKLKKKWKS